MNCMCFFVACIVRLMNSFSYEAAEEARSTSRALDLVTLRVHNTQQPASRLPDDILLPIFELAGEDSTAMALSFSHVCYVWRSVALVCKRLWNSLELSQPHLAIEFMNRSRPLPMSLRFHKRDPDFSHSAGLETLVEAFRCAIEESARTEEIVFRTYDCEDIIEYDLLPVLQAAKPTFPRLRRLVTDFRWTPAQCPKPEHEPCTEDAVDLAHFFYHEFPALRELTLDDCTVSSAFLLRCSPTFVDFGHLNLDCADLFVFLRHAASFLEGLRVSVSVGSRLAGTLVDKESVALPTLRTLGISGHLSLVSRLLARISVPPSTQVILSAIETPKYDLDFALTWIAEFINRHYTAGEHILSWVAQGSYNIRVACKGHDGLVEITGADIDHTAFAMFCFRLNDVLRERITLLRVRDDRHDLTSTSQRMAAPQWLALADVLRHVRTVYISGGPASTFLRAYIIPLDEDAVFFPEVAVVHLFECHPQDPLYVPGEREVFVKHLQDILVAISDRDTPLRILNVGGVEALPLHLRTLAMRAPIALYHRGECVNPRPALGAAESTSRVWSPPERFDYDFELNHFDYSF